MVNGFANHEYYKLSSVYRLPRLFNPSGSFEGQAMKQFLFFNNSSQGLLVLTSYLPSGDIKRTPFKEVLKEGYQSYISFKTEEEK